MTISVTVDVPEYGDWKAVVKQSQYADEFLFPGQARTYGVHDTNAVTVDEVPLTDEEKAELGRSDAA